MIENLKIAAGLLLFAIIVGSAAWVMAGAPA